MTLLLFLTSGGGPKYVDATCSVTGDLSAVSESRAAVKPYAECNVLSAGVAAATDVTSLVPVAVAAGVSSAAAVLNASVSTTATASASGDIAPLLYKSTFTATAIASENGGLLFLPTKPNQFAVCDVVSDSAVSPAADLRSPVLPLPVFAAASSLELGVEIVTSKLLASLCEVVAAFAVSIPPRSEAAPAAVGAGRIDVGGTADGGGRTSTGAVLVGASRETSGSVTDSGGRVQTGSVTSGTGRS